MAKSKTTTFFCRECGYETPRWMGHCPGCGSWNSFVEAPAVSESRTAGHGRLGEAITRQTVPLKLSEIEPHGEKRISSGFTEFDRVLGGGIVPASLVLVGGDPGIGKSTLLLQVCRKLASSGRRVLYISGEESLSQIKLRAERIGEFSGELAFLSETDLDAISEVLKAQKPDVVIIDSIQTMFRAEVASAPGSPAQVRESTGVLLQLAKGLGITIFIVGHVTKEGSVAGPRMLEHMVDVVLYFEGDKSAGYRILRGVKNRFGATDEIGVFEMRSEGLAEVTSPSEYLLSGQVPGISGSITACSVEGTRPLLLEIQALICRSSLGVPRRTAAGADYNRIGLILAVLEKRLGCKLSECDAYINIAGGMKISEPALDLGIALAVISSCKDIPIGSDLVAFGEIGLSGEIRAVRFAQARVNEAIRLGYKTCVLPGGNLKNLFGGDKIKIIGVNNIAEAVRALQL